MNTKPYNAHNFYCFLFPSYLAACIEVILVFPLCELTMIDIYDLPLPFENICIYTQGTIILLLKCPLELHNINNISLYNICKIWTPRC